MLYTEQSSDGTYRVAAGWVRFSTICAVWGLLIVRLS